MNLFAVLLLGGSAAAGTVEDARYLHWTGQDEVAAATLEPWLAKHPDDVEAHQLYIEIRVRGMGEGAVVSAEYASWAAPDQEVAAAVREALTRAMSGEPALVPEHPLPPILNKRWVKYLLKKWTDDPVSLRMSVDELWGLDAPIGSDADRLRKEILALVAEQAKSDDPMWLETSRSVTAAAEIPGLSTVALQRLVRNDPDAWPGAIDDVATIRVMRAARAVSRDVALERLGKLDLEDAPESDQLRHSLRGEILTAQGQKSGALEAYQKAWEASPGDATTALGFGRAALAAEASLDDAITAVRAAIRLAEQQDWTERDRAHGMLWPEAYTRILADRKVDLGHLQDVLRKLNRATGARTPEVRQPAPAGQSEDHLAAGLDRDDRFGTRHLVQAIRLAQLEGNAEVVSQAKARLKRNEAWFLGGLDARVKGWNNAVGQPEDLRPVAGERVGESIAGEPLTDFELDIDGATTRLTELGGLRVLAAFAPNCDACTGFLREVDELARKYQSAGRFIAVDISGDDRSVDKLMKNADVAFEVANTSGDLPQDFAGGGVPRLYIVSSEGVVIGDSGHRPSTETMWRTLGKALTDVAFESAGSESTPSRKKKPPVYPPAAHWLGTPTARCVAKVVVTPDGKPALMSISECTEPFVTASRAALEQWTWAKRPTQGYSMVAVDFGRETPMLLDLPPAECLWSSTVAQDGSHSDVFTTCEGGPVRSGPIPWHETARATSTSVGSPGGSMTIHNVNLPVPCEVVIDVGPLQLDLSNDPGTCPDAVVQDAAERVRRWDWDLGFGRNPPVRLVLRFEPPG